METNLSSPVFTIHEARSARLNDTCKHSHTLLSDMRNHTSTTLIEAYPWLKTALFPFSTQSLMYCAIPKIASKTLISLMLYVYVRDLISYFENNSTNRNQTEKLINISELVVQLRKNEITILNTEQSSSIVSFLKIYLHILQFESVNSTSPSMFFNPWRLNLDRIFPDIQFKNLLNVSQVFAPSYTRMLFVRHPFERLASAYNERIATLAKDRIQPEPLYDNVRKMICRRFTKFNSTEHPLSRRHPCEEFIPPFEHFVRYILTNTETPTGLARMDNHWKPYTMICQVCNFQYNFIGKYETFNGDFNFLLKRFNVSDWSNLKRRGASGHTTYQYRQLFSTLSNDLICRLKHLYRDDFHLFNYRLEDYVNRTNMICPS